MWYELTHFAREGMSDCATSGTALIPFSAAASLSPARSPVNDYVSESVDLQGDNALCTVLVGKEKINLFFFLI